MRIETIDDLIPRLEEFFLKIDVMLDREKISDMGNYGVMFGVPGKIKPLVQSLKTHTESDSWDGESVFWVYKNDKENWRLAFASAPHIVLCIGSVISLYDKHIDEFRR